MKYIVHFVAGVFLVCGVCAQADPTFADLAVLLAKGQFKEHVSADASLEECAAFLNRQGICFPLFDLVDRSRRVTKEDFARVIGQSRLRFLGEAVLENGCIKKPDSITSWVDYCLLNDVSFENLWRGFVKRTEKKSLPEVEQFYGKSF